MVPIRGYGPWASALFCWGYAARRVPTSIGPSPPGAKTRAPNLVPCTSYLKNLGPLQGLVDGAEEVVDGLDGVEGGDGDFDKDGGPVAHGAVPQAGEFECAQCLAVQ